MRQRTDSCPWLKNLELIRKRKLLKASVSHNALRHNVGVSVRQSSTSLPSLRARLPPEQGPLLPLTAHCCEVHPPHLCLFPFYRNSGNCYGKLFWALFPGFDRHTVNTVSTPANGTIRVLVQTNLNCSNGVTVEN